MDDYREFCDAHEADIEEWHRYWLPNYFSITKGQLVAQTPIPLTTITGVGAGPFTSRGGGNGSTIRA
jgi:hypothetical protein